MDPELRSRTRPNYKTPLEREAFKTLVHFPYRDDYWNQALEVPEHRKTQRDAALQLHVLRRRHDYWDDETKFVNAQGGRPSDFEEEFSIAEANGHQSTHPGYYGGVLDLDLDPKHGGNKKTRNLTGHCRTKFLRDL